MKNFKKVKIATNNYFNLNRLVKINFFDLNDLKKVKNYHKKLGIVETPIYSLKNLAKYLKVKNIFLKDESSRCGLNAFKILGSSFAMHMELLKNPKIKVFCTATDGNHGKSVAYMAKKMKKKSIIFMPKNTVKNRIKSIEDEGAKVIIIDGGYDKAVKMAERCVYKENKITKNSDFSLIQDTAWDNYIDVPLNIMKGYLTQMDELFYQISLKEIDIIFIQVGVGSWAAAILGYLIKFLDKPPICVSVEPHSANCFYESINRGKLTSVENKKTTIMAGLNCGTISSLAWPILKYGITASICIPDSLVEESMKLLAFPYGDDNEIVSGESGAASLGGLLGLLQSKDSYYLKSKFNLNRNSNVLLINTEGATDYHNYQKIISD